MYFFKLWRHIIFFVVNTFCTPIKSCSAEYLEGSDLKLSVSKRRYIRSGITDIYGTTCNVNVFSAARSAAGICYEEELSENFTEELIKPYH